LLYHNAKSALFPSHSTNLKFHIMKKSQYTPRLIRS